MSCWQVLAIEPTSDKKAIKKAYAKLLKITRPDEDPIGFQHLYDAYQQALEWSEYVDDDDDDFEDDSIFESVVDTDESQDTDANTVEINDKETEVEVEKPEIINPTILTLEKPPIINTPEVPEQHVVSTYVPEIPETTNPLLVTTLNPTTTSSPEPNTQPVLMTPEQQVEIDNYLERELGHIQWWIQQLLQDEIATNDIKSWSFLKRSPLLNDLTWRSTLSYYVFEQVAKANLHVVANKSLMPKRLYVQREIINYLNGIFHWHEDWQNLEKIFSNDIISAIFNYIDPPTPPVPEPKLQPKLTLNQYWWLFLWKILYAIRWMVAIAINTIVACFLIVFAGGVNFVLVWIVIIILINVYHRGGWAFKVIALGHTLMGIKYKSNK